MSAQPYDYTDYKSYLLAWIKSRPHQGHGEKSKIAQALRCQVAYISQVLNAQAQLSLEQGLELCGYLELNSDESEYLLLLISQARAGTDALRALYEKKIQALLSGRAQIKNRVTTSRSLSPDDQARYFSSWHYSAVHLLLTIPGLNHRKKIQSHLRIDAARLDSIIDFLIHTQLATQTNGVLQVGPASIHLGQDASMIAQHHTQWRMKAIQSLDSDKPEHLHYSSAVTVARADIPAVRKILLSAIEQVRKTVKDSKEDSLYVYCLDLFEV